MMHSIQGKSHLSQDGEQLSGVSRYWNSIRCLKKTKGKLQNAISFYEFAGGPTTTRLQEAAVDIVDNDKCIENYANQRSALIDERVVCAGKGGKDACQVIISES